MNSGSARHDGRTASHPGNTTPQLEPPRLAERSWPDTDQICVPSIETHTP